MTAQPRPSASIIWRLTVGFGVVLILVAMAAGLALWGMQSSMRDLRRAEQSFRQLETTRSIEAAFNRYLLYEIDRRLGGSGDPEESAEAGELRGALLRYRQQIGAEIAAGTNEAERQRERAEMVRANALSDLFETIETEAMLDRTLGREFDAAVSARNFLGQVAAGRDDAFRAVLFEVLQDERQEAEVAFADLDTTRARLTKAGLALGSLLLIAIAAFAWFLRRGLMRPIRGLSVAAQAFGGGQLVTRAPETLPGEFAGLAGRFNEMADRIATEQSRLQEQVAERTQALEDANRELTRIDAARRQFFANISHELRTPVTVLLGEAQIAARAKGEEPLREAIGRIAASAGFMRRRLDDLMRLARSEDGQLTLQMAPLDLSETARSAADIARSYAAANEIALETNLAEDMRVEGDAEALRQALLALIDNAVKFTPPGGTVSVTLTDDAGQAVLKVADTGPGFDGDPEHLFDRYAQESAGRAAGGTGLGLAIAKWIIDQHQGVITVANRAEGGAEFRMEFRR
ncbi:MAG: HAMP domain-containing sensor histidine kinase [Pseudomonadota bacterium]